MRIEEFTNQEEDKLPFDIVDDISVFMRNDPTFYRKELFPAIINMKDAYDRKSSIDATELFDPIVHKASHAYCKKFNIPKRPDDLLTSEDYERLVQKLYSEEMNNIQQGVY